MLKDMFHSWIHRDNFHLLWHNLLVSDRPGSRDAYASKNKHKLVHISCEVKFSQSTWAFICNYLTRYLPQYKKDGAGTKSFCKGKIKLMLKDLKNCEPPWWMSNLAEWLEHWCMLVKHPGARVRIHLMGHNYFPHSAYSQTELSSTLLQPKKL